MSGEVFGRWKNVQETSHSLLEIHIERRSFSFGAFHPPVSGCYAYPPGNISQPNGYHFWIILSFLFPKRSVVKPGISYAASVPPPVVRGLNIYRILACPRMLIPSPRYVFEVFIPRRDATKWRCSRHLVERVANTPWRIWAAVWEEIRVVTFFGGGGVACLWA